MESKEKRVIIRPATEEEKDGDFHFVIKEFTQEELKLLGDGVKAEHASALSFSSLAWYSYVKRRQVITFYSNEVYPIFMRECHAQGESFFKILKPLEPKKECRFMYLGKKERDYVNGLWELEKAHFMGKLPKAVICSGDRAALRCLSHGWQPIWLSAETAELSVTTAYTLRNLSEEVCCLPDNDAIGQTHAKILKLKYPWIQIINEP